MRSGAQEKKIERGTILRFNLFGKKLLGNLGAPLGANSHGCRWKDGSWSYYLIFRTIID